MVFRRPHRPTWYVDVRTPQRAARKTTGKTDRTEAEAVADHLAALAGNEEWAILDAVIDGRVSAADVAVAIQGRTLGALRCAIEDPDIEPFLDKWADAQSARLSPDTLRHYVHAVRTLVAPGVPFARSKFSISALRQWLADYPGSPGTRRKAHTAMTQFARYLAAHAVLPANPLRDVRAPRAEPPRCRWLHSGELHAIADRQPPPFDALSAILGGTGLELSAALRLRGADVDIRKKELRAPGTRPYSRGRVVRVAEWAWPFVAARVAALEPASYLFHGVDRWQAQRSHARACAALGIANYRLRDQRHSYAVRAARAGTPTEVIARQLGHANGVLVSRVYGPFMPRHQDRDRWERIAALQDAERAAAETVDVEWCRYHPVYQARTADRSESPKQKIYKGFQVSLDTARDPHPGTDGAL